MRRRELPDRSLAEPGHEGPSPRILDAVLGLLGAAGRLREQADWNGVAAHLQWAQDLLAQAVAELAPGPATRQHADWLCLAHRDLARAACEGDAQLVDDAAELIAALRDALERRAARTSAGASAA